MSRYSGGWGKYVPVAKRQAQAKRKMADLKKIGYNVQPVEIEGRTIARTFWGKKWCDNLEAYSDYANRLDRGRTYVRNGSVVDLQIGKGKVTALVCGSELYQVKITIKDLDKKRWQAMLGECAGQVASLVELLQGRLSSAVMDVVTRHGKGLFPAPDEITFKCNCPDYASMCKHVAASLYGVGARLDTQPEVLFLLRGVDPLELITQASNVHIADTPDTGAQTLGDTDLSALFGIDLGEPAALSASPSRAAIASAKAPASSAKAPASSAKVASTAPVGTAKPAPNTKVGAPAATTRKTAAATKRAANPKLKKGQTITPADLLARGVPRSAQQYWLKNGVLVRTEERGVYRCTSHTQGYVDSYLMGG